MLDMLAVLLYLGLVTVSIIELMMHWFCKHCVHFLILVWVIFWASSSQVNHTLVLMHSTGLYIYFNNNKNHSHNLDFESHSQILCLSLLYPILGSLCLGSLWRYPRLPLPFVLYPLPFDIYQLSKGICCRWLVPKVHSAQLVLSHSYTYRKTITCWMQFSHFQPMCFFLDRTKEVIFSIPHYYTRGSILHSFVLWS